MLHSHQASSTLNLGPGSALGLLESRDFRIQSKNCKLRKDAKAQAQEQRIPMKRTGFAFLPVSNSAFCVCDFFSFFFSFL